MKWNHWSPQKFKNQLRPLLRPSSVIFCQHICNIPWVSHETVPLREKKLRISAAAPLYILKSWGCRNAGHCGNRGGLLNHARLLHGPVLLVRIQIQVTGFHSAYSSLFIFLYLYLFISVPTVGAQSIARLCQNLIKCRRNIWAHRRRRKLRFFLFERSWAGDWFKISTKVNS